MIKMKKILLISLGIIILVGIVTAISLSNIDLSKYTKVRDKIKIETKGICDEKRCDKNTPTTLSLEGSGLKIDVLRNNNVNKEILHIYGK